MVRFSDRALGALHRRLLSSQPRLSIGQGARIARSARIYTEQIDGFVDIDGTIQIGDRTNVCDGAILAAYGGQIRIGDDCYVGPYCVLYGHGGLSIGSTTLIGAHTVIIPADHVLADPELPISAQGDRRRGIDIGDGVWIGAGVKILDGVKIGTGAVVAAGAVVKTDVPSRAVVGGIPAKILGNR